MILFFIILALVCVYGMKIYGPKEFNQDYISMSNTTAVKGVFVFLIFMSHFLQYYTPVDAFDMQYKAIRVFIGQLVVVMFFFYSGYGILESVKRKGTDYIKGFPVNRILKTLLHLDLALVLYIIRNLIMNVKMKPMQIILSLFGWDTVGNSNWFMFAVLILYVAIYLSFMLFRKHKFLAILASTVLTGVYVIAMHEFSGKEEYWYNTVMCLPLGMYYSFFKEKIHSIVMKNDIIYHIALVAVFVAFMFAHENKRPFVIYTMWTLLFTVLVVLVTMKVKIGNKALYWLGNHVFSVYILQRFPMAIFKRIDVIDSNRYLFFILSFVATVIMAELFDRGVAALDKVLFDRKKRPAKADLKKV
ncbi:MAG: acyltransferase family protein [Clostridia bacterium]|nr:acyltransferase family protein [Clostridia bacterium]